MAGLGRLALRAAALILFMGPACAAASEPAPEQVARGEYLLHAAGCVACHTDEKGGGPALAGGRALKTPFGTFHTPNLTPHPDHGLGRWSEADFARSLARGRAPDGRPYYAAFPFTAYSGMAEQDVTDLWAYLRSIPASDRPNKGHELEFPFNIRLLAGVWQTLFFAPGRFVPDPAQSEAWNRGAYLVRHLGHCGECHSPRGALGAVDPARELAGSRSGPDGKKVPNITPHDKDGIGDWSAIDLTFFFETGILPDGDVAGGAMGEVIDLNTSKLSGEDRDAIAAYLQSLPSLPGP